MSLYDTPSRNTGLLKRAPCIFFVGVAVTDSALIETEGGFGVLGLRVWKRRERVRGRWSRVPVP